MLKTFFLCTFLFMLSQSLRLFYHQNQHDQLVVQTKTPRYYFNEAETKSQCSLNGMCDGERKCSAQGKCIGIARPEKSKDYVFDETLTNSICPIPGDYNFAISDYFCTGMRKCQDGKCV